MACEHSVISAPLGEKVPFSPLNSSGLQSGSVGRTCVGPFPGSLFGSIGVRVPIRQHHAVWVTGLGSELRRTDVFSMRNLSIPGHGMNVSPLIDIFFDFFPLLLGHFLAQKSYTRFGRFKPKNFIFN